MAQKPEIKPSQRTPKKVGLTGGIGSGKTTIAGFFRELGIPVYIADAEAKKIMDSSPAVRTEIISLLGEKAFPNRLPNRKYIASQVFEDEKLLKSLNEIIHPRVHADFEKWTKKQQTPYVIYEAAILFEHGGEKRCDYSILVTAPKEERIKRVMKRDGVSREMVEARMQHQWPEEEKMKLADFIIENLNIYEAKSQTKQVHSTIIKQIPS